MERIVTVHLDKERHLKYGIKAFIAYEKATGKSFSQMDEGFESIMALLYSGLVWEDRNLSLDAVISIVDNEIDKKCEEGMDFKEAMNEVTSKVMEKVMKAMGEQPEANALPSDK